MIEEQVTVIAVENGQLILEAQTKSTCGGCAAKKACGTAALSKVVGKKFTHFRVKDTVNAKVGDVVVIGMSERALLSGSFMIYLLPIAGMIVMALLADAFLAPHAGSRDISVAISSLLGLFVGIMISRWFFSSDWAKADYNPVIIRKIISKPFMIHY